MSCFLRIIGENLDVDSLLAEMNLEPCHIWRKGERRKTRLHGKDEYDLSGISFYASDAPLDDFEKQLEEATNCSVPSDSIPIRSWPLFRAEGILRSVIESRQIQEKSKRVIPLHSLPRAARGFPPVSSAWRARL
jgi:hypothetical protein